MSKQNETVIGYALCCMLISKNINKFGIFGDNERNRTACLQHIRRYIHSVAWKELDFVRYDTNYKTIYFSKRNPGFTSLIAECKARGWTFDIKDKIKRAQIENVEEINISFNRYRSILHHVFADDVHYSIRYDGDGERIYVKHDGDGRFEEFKAMIYEMVANTVVVNGFSDFREINILQRLLMERIGNDNVRFVGIANNGDDDTYSLTVYDDRIGSDDGFRNMVEAEIEDIRLSWIEHMELDQDTLRMVGGQNGDHLNAMLEWCGLQDIDKSLVQASWGSGKMYFGIHREDGRLQQVKALIHHLVDHRVEIALNAKEYQYLMKNRQWNLKCIQHDFPKCCLLINTLTADKMFFYGTDKVKLQIMDRIKSLENP